MKHLALLSILVAPMVQAQTPETAKPPEAAAPQAVAPQATVPQKTVEDTASPELVSQLVKDVGVTPTQAEGAAGALFGLAKTRLKPEEFAKVVQAVPNMDGLLKAAPAADAKVAAMQAVTGQTAAGAAGLASLTSSLSKLGLGPEAIAKLAPSLVKAVESKGGAEVGKLLAGVLR